MNHAQRIRNIVKAHGRLNVDLTEVSEDANLYALGMTSHAAVNVMLGLEAEFGFQFPEGLLTREVFASISTLRVAIEPLANS